MACCRVSSQIIVLHIWTPSTALQTAALDPPDPKNTHTHTHTHTHTRKVVPRSMHIYNRKTYPQKRPAWALGMDLGSLDRKCWDPTRSRREGVTSRWEHPIASRGGTWLEEYRSEGLWHAWVHRPELRAPATRLSGPLPCGSDLCIMVVLSHDDALG